MTGRVLIVGQGLAGTALGLELEARGIDFLVVSEGHATAASRVAAGLVNPVTGQRWTRSAHVDELLPVARAAYARWEQVLGATLWHPLRFKRLWRDASERATVETKLARGDLAPYATRASADEAGVAIAGAAWVDLPALLTAAAARWQAAGRLRPERLSRDELTWTSTEAVWRGEKFTAVVCCTGAGALAREAFRARVALRAAKGEILVVRGAALAPDDGLSRGTWVLGGLAGTARVGATFAPDREDLEPSETARVKLLADAEAITGCALEVTGHAAGVRVAAPDRLPVVGWHPQRSWLGIFGGLSSKGTLWAPTLAAVWGAVLAGERTDFPEYVDLGRRGLLA